MRADKRRKAPPKMRPIVMPQFIEPQLATLVTDVPAGRSWLHEIKLDGYRIFCRIDNGKFSILTRKGQDWTDRFGAVVRAATDLPVRGAIIDGELVAVENDGRHSFQRLQNSFADGAARLIYYAFDLLYVDGRDLRAAPLIERKKSLQSLLSDGAETGGMAVIRYSEHRIGGGRELFTKACEMGLEGIVSKRIDDPYRSGRTRSWLKIKCSQNQEFVIGGFTDPAGARLGFGALLLGVHEHNGALRYSGRVGTGFDERSLRDLLVRLKKLERKSMPFERAAKGVNFKGVHWVEPQLVCEVVFTGWTADGLLRHPSFKGLREDKPPAEVIREVAARAGSPHTSSE